MEQHVSSCKVCKESIRVQNQANVDIVCYAYFEIETVGKDFIKFKCWSILQIEIVFRALQLSGPKSFAFGSSKLLPDSDSSLQV